MAGWRSRGNVPITQARDDGSSDEEGAVEGREGSTRWGRIVGPRGDSWASDGHGGRALRQGTGGGARLGEGHVLRV